MTCHDAREWFSALVDDALAPGERAGLDRHLEACSECRRELARFRATLGLVQRIEPVRAPAGFVDRVMARAFPVPWYRRLLAWLFLPLRWKVPLEAAAVVLVSASALYVFHRMPEVERAALPEASRPEAAAPSGPLSAPTSAAPGSSAAIGGKPDGGPAAPPAARPGPSAPSRRESRKSGAVGPTPETPALRDRQTLAKEAVPAEPRGPSPGAPGPAREVDRAETKPPGAAGSPRVGAVTPTPGGPTPGASVSGRLATPSSPPPAPARIPAPAAGAPPAAPPSPSAAPAPGGSSPAPASGGSAAAPAPDAPAKLESSTDLRSGAAQERAKAAPPRAMARLLVPPDVGGRLRVAAREPAETALDALAARIGATRVLRRADAADPRTVVVELVVPRAAYPELVEGLAGIGAWAPERAPDALPPRVRVEIAITE